MKVSRRASNRIPVRIEAEFVSNKTSCLGLVKNISECGIYVEITHIEHIENLKPNINVNLKFRFRTGQFLHLKCNKIWSIKNPSNSLIEHVGLKIIRPPQEYNNIYQAVKFFKQ